MFEKLQKKWKVSAWRLVLILITFATGGSLTGYAGRKLMPLLGIESPYLYIPVYIIIVTILWPLIVLLVSIPLGQFYFFLHYINNLLRRFRGSAHKRMQSPENSTQDLPLSASDEFNKQLINEDGGLEKNTRLAIFASGAGTNARKIIEYCSSQTTSQDSKHLKVVLIVCNKAGAGVLAVATDHHIPVLLIEKKSFFSGDHYFSELKEYRIEFLILAGFLWKIPQPLIRAYPGRIINIHPALLPKYGGEGMYGDRVHEEVIKAGEKESGITIHYVDEYYDHGEIIFQAKCSVLPNDTVETLSDKVHSLEHEHYGRIIAEVAAKKEVKKWSVDKQQVNY